MEHQPTLTTTLKANLSMIRMMGLSLALFVCGNASAQSWSSSVEVTDARGSGGDIGKYNSMTVVNGNPTIATVDLAHQRISWVRAADADGTVWNEPVSIRTPRIQGRHFSVAVVNGNPAIAYTSGISDTGDTRLMYIRANDANGDTWGAPVQVDTTAFIARRASLQVVNGKPAIAYTKAFTNYACYYVRAADSDGQTWTAPILLSTVNTAAETNPALEIVNGFPAVAFRNDNNAVYLRATDADGSGWGSIVTLGTNVNPVFFSLRVIAGIPCMAYYNSTTQRTKFHRANDADGLAWGLAVNTTFSSEVVNSYLLFESDGWPAVVVSSFTSGTVVFRRPCDAAGLQWAGCGVTSFVIDAPSTSLVYLAVCLVNGNPAVAYAPDASSPLRLAYCRASNTTGTTWNTPVLMSTTPKVGLHAVQCVVSGNPALAYYDETNKDLRYIRANDPLGQTWGTSITIDSVGDVGSFASMQLVNGQPAISYYDATLNLKYVRASDALGLAWGAPIALPSVGTSYGQGTSLAVVAGRPAVAFANTGAGDLYYIRALDADGVSWPSTSNYILSNAIMPSLIDLAGLPAVAIHGWSSDLLFRLASDPDGTAWPTGYTVDATGFVGLYPSMIDLNGHPAISYYDDTNTNLKYAYSFNTTGTNWSLQTVTDLSSLTPYSSLAVMEGYPAIACAGTNATTRFIRTERALNAMGTNWSAGPVEIEIGGGPPSHIGFLINGFDAGISYYDPEAGYPYYIGGQGCALGTPAPTSTTPPGNLVACYGQPTTLSATGANLTWLYFNAVVGTGNAFTTQPIIQNSTFVVRDSACYVSANTNIAVTVNTVDVGVMSSTDTLTATATGVQYQWVDCNNGFANMPGATDQEFSGPTGVYAVVITDGACADTSACVPIINTAAGEWAGPSLVEVFPNPAQRTLNIRFQGSGVAELSLLDICGRHVRNVLSTQQITNLDVAELPRGCYVLQVLSSGSNTSHRVVLE